MERETKRMKILFLTATYWPAQDGVSVVTQYLAEGLAKRHEVHVLATRREYPQKEEHEGVRIQRIQAARSMWNCTFQGEKKQAESYILEYQPDVLIVVGIQTWCYDWFIRNLERLPGKKMLMTHGSSCLGEYDVWSKLKQVRLRRRILADLIDVNFERYWKKYQKALPQGMGKFEVVSYLFAGEDLYEYMKRCGLQNSMILENATQDFFFDRRVFAIDDDKELVFINVSTYEERKNQKMILQAYGETAQPGTRLVLIGSRRSAYYQELLEMKEKIESKDSFAGKIEIHVGIPREKVLEIYQSADVYVSASSWEAMSISLCEAAAGGLLILSTDVGHASQIPGVQLFETKEELKNLMQEACRDSGKRRECGRLSYEYAEENYRIQRKVDLLEGKLLAMCGEVEGMM